MSSYRETAPSVNAISSFIVPSIRFQKSDQGTQYFHQETAGIGAVSCFWLIPVQKKNQEKAFQALAAVEMLLSGGDGKSEQEILQHIEHLGASVGNDSESLYARIHFRCAKPVVIEVFDWILHHVERAEYPKEELQRYALVKRASMERKMQTPGYWSERLVKERLYMELPWVGTSGNLDDFEALTTAELQQFHQRHIKNSGGVLFFSGDIDEKQVSEALTLWESYPRHPFKWELPEENVKPHNSFNDVFKHPVPNTSQISMRWAKHIGYLSEEQQHQYTLLNMVLGGYFGSRLMQELREKQGLTYGISSYFQPLWKGRTWYISGEMNSDNLDKALSGIKEILSRLQNERIDAEELDRAKKYYAGMFRSGFDGPFAQATKSLQTLVREYSTGYYSNTLDTLWSIDSESLLILAQNVFDPNSFVKVLAGDTK